ncbi:hypothetical protein D1BOALGB6SA_8180 [Olavius sp. associated proteobacterium Delta 1]|nr:hypothetical protein D1BOALGB6SA_8180 [Olavius sp. associated proteobacterium Delta 1]
MLFYSKSKTRSSIRGEPKQGLMDPDFYWTGGTAGELY